MFVCWRCGAKREGVAEVIQGETKRFGHNRAQNFPPLVSVTVWERLRYESWIHMEIISIAVVFLVPAAANPHADVYGFSSIAERDAYFAGVQSLLSHVESGYSASCRKIFHGKGFTFGHSWQDWYMWWNVFRHSHMSWGSGTYVEIGTNDPTWNSNSLFFDKCLGWRGVCIEPQEMFHAKIRSERSCSLVPRCVSVTGGDPSEREMRSITLVDEHNMSLFVYQKTFKTRRRAEKGSPVTCVDAGEVLPKLLGGGKSARAPIAGEHAPAGEGGAGRGGSLPVVDLLLVDIDGMEAAVMQCFPLEAMNVRAVLIETIFAQMSHVDAFFHRRESATKTPLLHYAPTPSLPSCPLPFAPVVTSACPWCPTLSPCRWVRQRRLVLHSNLQRSARHQILRQPLRPARAANRLSAVAGRQ